MTETVIFEKLGEYGALGVVLLFLILMNWRLQKAAETTLLEHNRTVVDALKANTAAFTAFSEQQKSFHSQLELQRRALERLVDRLYNDPRPH